MFIDFRLSAILLRYCDQCVKTAESLSYRDLIKVTPDERTFHFTVEVRRRNGRRWGLTEASKALFEEDACAARVSQSTGVMPPEKIVEMAFDVLVNKLTEVETHATVALTKATSLERGGPQRAQP